MNIYVSNLSPETTGDELKRAFALYGEVKNVVIICDERADGHEAGRYGYVEMTVKSEGTAAISNLNGTKVLGRVINTIEALPLSDKKKPLSRKPVSHPRWTPKVKRVI
ncbi:MAG: RNA-binding protein [Dehalococcoidia bacterium]|nr:RNA-binding protein [Dehalococcoidia bacterium]